MYKLFSKIVSISASIVNFFVLVLVLLITFDVLVRYVFNYSIAASFELEWHLFSVIILLGMGSTLKKERHVRVDVFFGRYSKRLQLYIDLFLTVLFFTPFCWIYIYYSFPYALHAFEIGEASPDAGGLPVWWIIKFIIPLGFLILFIQGVLSFVIKYKQVQKKHP